MFWTNLWSALTALGTLALAGATFWVTSKDSRRTREGKKPFVRADATNQDSFAGSGLNIAETKCSIEPEVRIVNLGNYPVHIEAAMWWSDRMLEQEYVLPRTQLLGLTIPSGENVIARLDMALTISNWGWLRFYFVNGATGDVYPYVEIPMYLNKYVDEATYGYDDTIPSHVHFNFEGQKPGVDTIPWNEVRHTFKADGGHLFDDQQASIKYERSHGSHP